MKNLLLPTLLTASALALFGCQSSPSTTNNNTSTPTATTAPTATANVANNNVIRTLNPVACNNQSVTLDLNQGGVRQEGVLQGYNYCEYQIPLQAGQHLNVNFGSPSTGAYVIAYGHDELGATALVDDGYTATQNEVLPVRVLLTRNVARSSEQFPFRVQFTLN